MLLPHPLVEESRAKITHQETFETPHIQHLVVLAPKISGEKDFPLISGELHRGLGC